MFGTNPLVQTRMTPLHSVKLTVNGHEQTVRLMDIINCEATLEIRKDAASEEQKEFFNSSAVLRRRTRHAVMGLTVSDNTCATHSVFSVSL